MAFTTCNAADFATYGACLTQGVVGPRKQLALLLLATVAAYDLAQTDTASTDMTTALNTADTALCGLTDDQVIAGLAASFFAYSDTSEPSADDKNNFTACIVEADDTRLKRAIAYWLCKLLHG